MKKTYQFKKVCKDDSHELAELKQQNWMDHQWGGVAHLAPPLPWLRLC